MKTGAGIPPGTTSEGPSQTSPETMAFPVTVLEVSAANFPLNQSNDPMTCLMMKIVTEDLFFPPETMGPNHRGIHSYFGTIGTIEWVWNYYENPKIGSNWAH